MPDHPARRHSRVGGNPVPFSSRADPQRRWIPDIAPRFRDDDQNQRDDKLKAGWRLVPVSEIADHCLGKMLDKQKNKGELRPYLRNLNVRWFNFDLSDVLEMRFEDGETDRYQARKGDLIVCEGGYPGRAAIWDSDEPVFLQKALHRVRFNEPERAKWVLYWLYLRDMDGTLTGSFNGAGIQHFTKAALARFEVPLPPLEEQKRIVAVLDQAFAALDRARANAGANLADAQSLFAASIRQRFDSDVAEFGSVDLDALAEHVTDGDHQPPPKVAMGVPFITISNIDKVSRCIDFSDTFYVSDEYFQRLSDRRRAKNGDILYTVTGSFGIPVIVSEECGDFCFQRHIGLIRPKSSVNSKWLSYMLGCPQMYDQANDGATGTAQRTVSLKVLRRLQVPDVPESKQRAAVRELDVLWGRCGNLASFYQTKLADLADLRQSLLQQAFAGEL